MKSKDNTSQFKPVSPVVDLPKLEEEVLSYWKKNKVFEKSLEKDAPNGNWTFLDGPPFVTGLPHYGSLLSSLPKDVFPRFWTMNGYKVRRVWGWDGHGLPIENKVENELNLTRKKDIEEKVGVKTFIDKCKEYVNHVSSEWEWYVDHVGRWVDFKNAYKTWELPYMESVMWVFRQMYDKKFIYKGLRVSLYCPHCATPISNFETALDNSYKEIQDAATTYKYEVKDEPGTYILAWSTTPWNKIVTPALAINPAFTYIKVQQGKEKYILAESTKKMLIGEYQVLEKIKGKDLVGKEFVPHYDYYPVEPGKKAFVVIGGDFVTAEEGTGVVTIAVYGEEDLKAMQENNIHMEMHVDDEGTIKPDVPLFGGMYYLKANKAVNEDLAKRGLIYKDEEVPHNVPVCWRCSTRLYYAPLNAWFVNVQVLKKEMEKTNEYVNWYPGHFKHGRFLKSLQNAPDWCISRNRYWGSPVPVWECECGEMFVPGSIQELEEKSGKKVVDLHKPDIDEITINCEKCGKEVKRVPEVLDSWIEAGSASFGERHYPFDSKERLEDFYPPDFIIEYTGQIRAWFYVLHVIANALHLRKEESENKLARNVGVTGVILGTDGRKMSKNFKNYPDPKEMLQKYGGDALRLYLLGNPVMRGEDMLISEEQYKLQVRGVLLMFWNIYNFFITYAIADNWQRDNASEGSENVLDQWILSKLQKLNQEVTDALKEYDTVKSIAEIQSFIDELSTWYIRRSRDRVGSSAADKNDKESFYQTCFEVLVTLCKLTAPIIPFISETMYRNLTGEESVHLTDWPGGLEKYKNKELEDEMAMARQIVEKTHAKRKEAGIKVRQPLGFAKITNVGLEISAEVDQIIKDETNVKEFEYKRGDGQFEVELDTKLTPALKTEGEARDIMRQIQEERKKLGTKLDEFVNVTLPSWPKEFEEEIKKKALIKDLQKGATLSVTKA